MKRIYALVVLGLLFCLPHTQSSAYNDWTFSVSYSMATPTGNLNTYIDQYSWSGINAEVGYKLDEHNSIGVTSGWQLFSGLYRNDLIVLPQGALFGTQVRNAAAVPILAVGRHMLGQPDDHIQPFIGMGAGAYVVTQKFAAGIYELSNTNTHFGLMPLVGLRFKLDRKSALDVQIDYNAAFASGTNLIGEEQNSYGWIGLKVGFLFK